MSQFYFLKEYVIFFIYVWNIKIDLECVMSQFYILKECVNFIFLFMFGILT